MRCRTDVQIVATHAFRKQKFHRALIGASVIQRARIAGKVEYPEGDGPNVVIRPGPCEVEETAMEVTISWVPVDLHGSASMPIADCRLQAVPVDTGAATGRREDHLGCPAGLV